MCVDGTGVDCNYDTGNDIDSGNGNCKGNYSMIVVQLELRLEPQALDRIGQKMVQLQKVVTSRSHHAKISNSLHCVCGLL